MEQIIEWFFAVIITAVGLWSFVMGLVEALDGGDDSHVEILGGIFLVVLGVISILSLCGVPLS